MTHDDELWLNAGVDGELDAERSRQLQARLAADPALQAAWNNQAALRDAIRERVPYHTAPAAVLQRLQQTLQQTLRGDGTAAKAAPDPAHDPTYDPAPDLVSDLVHDPALQAVHGAAHETVPAVPAAAAGAAAGRSPARAAAAAAAPVRMATAARRLWLVAAASALAGSALTAAVTLWVGGGGGANPGGGGATAEQALAGHTRALLAERPIEVASSDQHTVKPWLAARLGYAPPVPDLSSHGFELLGARRDWIDGRTVAALVYRRRQHLISVFVEPGGGGEGGSVRSTKLRGFNVVQTAHDGMACAIVSDLNAKELGDFAELLRAAL